MLKSIHNGYAKAKSGSHGNSFVFVCNARLAQYFSIAGEAQPNC